jgi:ribokinase
MSCSPRILVVGSLNMDLVVEAERAPQMGETILGKRIHYLPGGKGANQAVAAARLGARTTMIGAVGTDGFGDSLLQALAAEGIETAGVKRVEEAATGIASILLADGDNSIVVVPGANGLCTAEDLDRCEERFAEADVVLLQLEIPVETVLHAARLAKKHGKTVVLNPAPARVLPAELLACVDVLTPNRSELALLAGVDVGADGLEAAMRRVVEMGVRQVVTTLGAEGSAFLDEYGIVERRASYRVPVVDTTGAGDSFNAGLAVALAEKQSLGVAMTFASKVSALAVMKLGAQTGMPGREAVEEFAWEESRLK